MAKDLHVVETTTIIYGAEHNSGSKKHLNERWEYARDYFLFKKMLMSFYHYHPPNR